MFAYSWAEYEDDGEQSAAVTWEDAACRDRVWRAYGPLFFRRDPRHRAGQGDLCVLRFGRALPEAERLPGGNRPVFGAASCSLTARSLPGSASGAGLPKWPRWPRANKLCTLLWALKPSAVLSTRRRLDL